MGRSWPDHWSPLRRVRLTWGLAGSWCGRGLRVQWRFPPLDAVAFAGDSIGERGNPCCAPSPHQRAGQARRPAVSGDGLYRGAVHSAGASCRTGSAAVSATGDSAARLPHARARHLGLARGPEAPVVAAGHGSPATCRTSGYRTGSCLNPSAPSALRARVSGRLHEFAWAACIIDEWRLSTWIRLALSRPCFPKIWGSLVAWGSGSDGTSTGPDGTASDV